MEFVGSKRILKALFNPELYFNSNERTSEGVPQREAPAPSLSLSRLRVTHMPTSSIRDLSVVREPVGGGGSLVWWRITGVSFP